MLLRALRRPNRRLREIAVATIKGGDKLGIELAKIAAQLSTAHTLAVGFLENSTYPDGTPVAMVAAIQDGGSRNIPPRPFFRNMVAGKSPQWPSTLATLLKNNRMNAARSLAILGEVIKGELRQSIVEFSGVPLAPSTIRRKGFDKQLIDTSHMLNSIDQEVQ